MRKFVDHVLRRAKQDSGVRFRQHRRIVVGIARRNHPEVQAVERPHRLALGIGLAQHITGHPILGNLQSVTEQRRTAELAHQRHGEFIVSVRQNHHLKPLAQPVEKFRRTVQRPHAGDHLLNVRQLQPVLIEQGQPSAH